MLQEAHLSAVHCQFLISGIQLKTFCKKAMSRMGKKLQVFLSIQYCTAYCLAASFPTNSFQHTFLPSTLSSFGGICLCIYICLTSLLAAIPLFCAMADCKVSYTVGNIKHIPLKDLNCIESNKANIMQCLLHFKLFKDI